MQLKVKYPWLLPILGAAIFLTAGSLFFHPKPSGTRLAPGLPIAFLNARWGMSRREVERANGKGLHSLISQRKFYTVKAGVKDKSKYRAMEEVSARRVLGRDATITYVFFNDHLFSYHVFVQSREPLELDQDMRKYLISRFGENFASSDENAFPKMMWSQKDIFVNYWFFKDDLSLSERYTAGYGVVYRAIEESIAD